MKPSIWLLVCCTLWMGCAGLGLRPRACDCEACRYEADELCFSTAQAGEDDFVWSDDGVAVVSGHGVVRSVLARCASSVRCRIASCRHTCQDRCQIAVGPPAFPPNPPMPPEFLPVPVSPTVVPVNPGTPVPARGAVERDFGPQFTVAGRD